jgi:hypothetical protein
MYIYELDTNFKTVTKFDVYDGLEFGVYTDDYVSFIRERYSDDKWLRIYLLKYPDNTNFINKRNLQKCRQKALQLKWYGIEYKPGEKYHPRGVVYAGLDCGHSGERENHSVFRADFIEVYGNHILWLNGFEWESTEDPNVIEADFLEYWRYYSTSMGYGDALKASEIAVMNNKMYDRALIETDRNDYPENSAGNWNHWDFAPQWNHGLNKYNWATLTKTNIDHQKLIIPYFDEKDDRPIAKSCNHLIEALTNVREINNKSRYPSLEIVDKKIGDDPFDSINMAVGCANDRAIIPIDLSKVKFSNERTVTSGLDASVVRELEGVGSEASFFDFGVN